MKSFDKICSAFPDIEGIIFISESKEDPSRRTYLLDNVIIKSCKLENDETSHLRQNDLLAEYKILNLCKSVKTVPCVQHYSKNEMYELLFLNYIGGTQLSNLQLSFAQHFKVTMKLAGILLKLSKFGISHNDITPQNTLVDENFKVSIIDFDQATRTTSLIAFLRQFFGLKIGESKVNYSIITIIKDYLRKKFPKAVYHIKKLLGVKFPEYEKLPDLEKVAEPKAKLLLKAWGIAQKSNASSPGLPIAYYSLEFNGIHFPGERPWINRWNELKNISDYNGKKILELGCNMGLLSTYLLKKAGASKCIAVDHDKQILKSARIISEVYNVNPSFHHVNFDTKKDWESELMSYNADIVFALNVLNWIKNKDRFLKFLSIFPEVIFEGHNLPAVEKQRFKEIGYTSIEEIGFSERERIILRCRK